LFATVAIMIYQTKPSILTELLSLDSRQSASSNSLLDDVLFFEDEGHQTGHQTGLAKDVSNDRTQLKHQK